MIEDFIVPEGQSQIELVYNGPTNSASAKYGNGYDLCGKLTYTLLNANGQEFSDERLSFNQTLSLNEADLLSFKLESEEYGTELTDTMILKIRLQDYPSSVPATFPIKLVNRECFPGDFVMPSFEDIKL